MEPRQRMADVKEVAVGLDHGGVLLAEVLGWAAQWWLVHATEMVFGERELLLLVSSW